jgi:tetratricopeptide (TPR) repeat protein
MSASISADLRAAANDTLHAALEVAAALDSDQGDDLRMTQDVGARLATVRRLQRVMSAALTRLEVAQAHRQHAERFAAANWPARRNALAARFALDPADGTSARIDAWCAAVTLGEWDEAERLSAGDLPIDESAVWLPDRLAAAVDALRRAAADPVTSLARLQDLFAALTAQPPPEPAQAISPVNRLAIACLHARLAAYARDSGTASVLGLVPDLIRAVGSDATSTVVADVLSTLSMLARYGVSPIELIPEPMWNGQPLPGPTSSQSDWDRILLSGAANDLRCAAELIRRREIDAASQVDGVAMLEDARHLMQSVTAVSGAGARLNALIEQAPDALLLALAERLRSEQCREEAEDVLTRVSAASSSARLETARLLLEIARDAGDPERLHHALTKFGDEALWSNEIQSAADAYRELRRSHPADADAARSLADALTILASDAAADQIERMLQEAVALCDESERLETVTPHTSWVLQVRYRARRMLAALPTARRSSNVWGMLRDAARGVQYRPDETDRWVSLCEASLKAGALRAALAAAQRLITLGPGNPDNIFALAATMAMMGMADAVDQVLDSARRTVAKADEDSLESMTLWVRSILALVREQWAEGVELARQVTKQEPSIIARLNYALSLTRSGAPGAVAEWNALWKDAGLSTYDGLIASLHAAMQLDLLDSARELGARVLAVDGSASGDADGLFVCGLFDLVDGAGDSRLRSAISRATVEIKLRGDVAAWQCTPLMRDNAAQHWPTVETLVEQHVQEIRATYPEDRDPAELADVELSELRDWVASEPDAVRAIDGARAALSASPDRPAEPAIKTEEEPPTIDVYLSAETILSVPASGKDHPLLRVRMPDARCSWPPEFPWVDFHDADELAGPDVAIVLSNGVIDHSQVPRDRWYLPVRRAEQMASMLPPPLQPSEAQAGLIEFAPPTDAIGRLRLWSPDEVIVRRIGTVWQARHSEPPQPTRMTS